MTWGNVAVAGATIVSGAMSADAAGDAADAASDAAGRSARQIADAARQARKDVFTQFPAAQQDLVTGASGAFDVFNQALGGQQQALGQGNLNAQGTIGQGFGQAQNALLGLPVDQSMFAPKGQEILDQAQANQFVNPFTQEGGSGLGGFAPIETQAQMNQNTLGGITNNADLLRLVASGDLEIPGLDTGFFGELAAQSDPNFLSSSSLLNIAPEQTSSFVDRQGFGVGGKAKLSTLLNALQGIKNAN